MNNGFCLTSENDVNFTIKEEMVVIFATGTVSNAVPWTERANLGDNQNDQFGYLFAQPNSQEQVPNATWFYN